MVQKAVDLEEYQDIILKGQLPLVVRLTEEEVRNKKFSCNPFSGLYHHTYNFDELDHQYLHEDRLREEIENKRIFISEFIDSNGNKKYVDYISDSHSNDFGSHIVFRNKKRLFKGSQARYSIERNHMSHYDTYRSNENSEELFSLCSVACFYANSKKESSAVQKRIEIVQ